MKTELSQYCFEYTDTFGGERNYCWVKRGKVMARDIKHAMRLAKKECGLSGYRGTEQCCAWQGGKAFRPSNSCTILDVFFDDSEVTE
jgi:hypothetical protein